MLSLTSSILLLSALFSFGSMVFIIRDNWKESINFFLSSFLFFLSIWAIVLIAFNNADFESEAIMFGNIAYIAALGIGTSLYLFSLVFPENKRPSLLRIFFIFIPFLVFVNGLLINPNFLISQITFFSNEKKVIIDSFGWFTFSVFFISLYILGVSRLWAKAKSAKLFVKKQLLIMINSLIITGVGGVFYNLILASPFFQNFNYLWSGPVFSTAVAAAIMYSVFRFHLFNVKVFFAEVLISLLWIFTFLRTLVSVDPHQEVFLNGLLFLLSFVLGVLLIKSIKKEASAREVVERQAQDLVKANEKLQSLDKLKSEFVSLASHQLRSPLTVIKGYASTLTDGVVGDLTPKQNEIVRHIYTATQGLASMVEDFLNVTKIEQGGMQYVFEIKDVSLIVRDIVNDMRIVAEDKLLDFSFTLEDEGPCFADIDSVKLKQVFLNLIDNSIKYTKEGFVRVLLSKDPDNSTITFSVSDSGAGVSQETRDKLFTKFGRGEGASLNGGGSGLGLYLANEIIKAHHGTIQVHSEGLGKGATFSVTIPGKKI